MKLYFTPYACSLAARIAIEEAELDADFIHVPPAKMLPDGRPFAAVSPMNYVPALETASGLKLSENIAVLSYLADLAAEDVLAPPLVSDERYRMVQWLTFIGTELHKGVFSAAMIRPNDEAERAAVRRRAVKPFDVLARHLAGRDTLLANFTVADAYLLAILNWCEHVGIAIADWPALEQWRAAMYRRPSVMRAMAAERPLLQAA